MAPAPLRAYCCELQLQPLSGSRRALGRAAKLGCVVNLACCVAAVTKWKPRRSLAVTDNLASSLCWSTTHGRGSTIRGQP